MRGRKPAPTHLKVVKGETKKSRLNPDEPKLEAGEPEVPQFCNKASEKEWLRVVPALVAAGVLTKLDGTVMDIYCSESAELQRLKRARAKKPLGSVEYKRIVVSLHQCHQRVMQAMAEIGLTPGARTRIKALPKPKANKWSDVGR